MRTREFEKLKVGDRVIVTGTQDFATFSNEPGAITEVETSDRVTITFDKWDAGWGLGKRQWGFYVADARKFNITVIPEEPKVEPKPEPVKPVVAKKRPHGKQEYRGNGKHDWEKVVGDTVRLRVPGGWLYGRQSAPFGVGTVIERLFVPVPQTVGYPI